MRERFLLPDSECERMTRNEMNAFKMLTVSVSEINHAKEFLARLIGIVPDGNERFDQLMTLANEFFEDMIGTVHSKQAKNLLNAVQDNEIRLMPKMAPRDLVIPVRKEEYQDMIDCAREKCKFCTEDGKTCERCKLYGLLVSQVPLEDYGDGISCPYAYQEWEE